MGVLGDRTHPCVGVCSTTTGDAVCRGCGRTVKEIRDWPAMTEQQRAEVMARTERDEPWRILQRWAAHLSRGNEFRTTLFGRVQYEQAGGELVGVIPGALQRAAYRHGFRIVFADFRNDCYVLEVL